METKQKVPETRISRGLRELSLDSTRDEAITELETDYLRQNQGVYILGTNESL